MRLPDRPLVEESIPHPIESVVHAATRSPSFGSTWSSATAEPGRCCTMPRSAAAAAFAPLTRPVTLPELEGPIALRRTGG
jgi:hypothetical protein